LGSEHPGTAQSLNYLGELYQAMSEYAKAEPLLQEALRIRQKALGSEHPDTATSLSNLALYQDMGEYAKAEPLYQEALKICRKVLGPEHPNTATGLDNLALLEFDLDRIDEASPCPSSVCGRINNPFEDILIHLRTTAFGVLKHLSPV